MQQMLQSLRVLQRVNVLQHIYALYCKDMLQLLLQHSLP